MRVVFVCKKYIKVQNTYMIRSLLFKETEIGFKDLCEIVPRFLLGKAELRIKRELCRANIIEIQIRSRSLGLKMAWKTILHGHIFKPCIQDVPEISLNINLTNFRFSTKLNGKFVEIRHYQDPRRNITLSPKE
jgi:hypothetical protein